MASTVIFRIEGNRLRPKFREIVKEKSGIPIAHPNNDGVIVGRQLPGFHKLELTGKRAQSESSLCLRRRQPTLPLDKPDQDKIDSSNDQEISST